MAVEALQMSPRSIHRQIFADLVARRNGLFVMVDGKDPAEVQRLVAEGKALEATFLDLSDRFHMSAETLLSSATGYQLPKGSWMTPIVDDVLLTMQQAGIVEYAVKRNQRCVHC